MICPLIIHNGRTYSPMAVSQDGYEADVLIGLVVHRLALGAGFTYARPCPRCHRGLMPCCLHCAAEGHDERCGEVKGIRERMRGR